jgi:hypothetical protein
VVDFAVAISPSDPTPTILPSGTPTTAVEILGEARYRIRAKVLYRTEKVMVLDFGLRVYLENPQGEPIEGDTVSAVVWLEVDGYPYVEEYAGLPGIPPLVYRWRIDRVLRSVGDRYEEVERTDVFGRDARRMAWYVLQCTLLEQRPGFWSRTATVAQKGKRAPEE